MMVMHAQAPLLVWPVQFCLVASLATYVLSLLTGNVSQVDRVWTFLPTIYASYFALLPLWPRTSLLFVLPYTPDTVHESYLSSFSPRALLMLALVATWMVRLTFHTWRRGLYNFNEEDYRWKFVRDTVPAWFFQLLNFVFISLIQNILLFLLPFPTKIALTQPHTNLAVSDYVLAALGLFTLLIELIADNQQYSYQTFKRTGSLDPNEWFGVCVTWTKRDLDRGFVTRGLWAWSRHPNLLCEQLFWIIINLIPLVCPDGPWAKEWPMSFKSLAPLLPSLALCLLMHTSTMMTEKISSSKYPVAYKAYQARVGMFIPLETPVRGVVLSAQGKRQTTDEVVYGLEVKKVE